jgi:transcriptional regulator with XRE-family HTH domain
MSVPFDGFRRPGGDGSRGSAGARLLSKLQRFAVSMPRPQLPPHLVPRQPKSVLGWTMQKLRIVNGWSGKQTAKAFGCSPSHISRVEQGSSRPSRALVQFYEDTFKGEGILLSLFEVVEHNAEDERRRAGGHRPTPKRAIPGDASTYVDDTIPHGTLMRPGELFTKTWRIRNSGSVPWIGRQLERQGPLTGPGLITSPRYLPLPDAQPGEIIEAIARSKHLPTTAPASPTSRWPTNTATSASPTTTSSDSTSW